MRDESWRAGALCAEMDPELWFPTRLDDAGPAKRVCARCPVTAECLSYAIGMREAYGIWGGVAERRRRRMLLQQQGAA